MNQEFVIESFISFCDDMMIAEEGFDVSKSISNAMKVFRDFFIKLFNKIKEWYRINFKKDQYIYKVYFENLQKYLDDGIKEYTDYIADIKKELAGIKKYIDTEYTNDAQLKSTVYSSNAGLKVHLSNSVYYERGASDKVSKLKESIENLKKKDLSKKEKDELRFDKELNLSKFQLISQKEISFWITKMKTFEKLGDDFDKYAKSLNIPEHAWNIMPYYNSIVSYATGFTKLFTKAFMDSLFDPIGKESSNM